MTRPLIGIPIGRDLPANPTYLKLRRTYSDAVSGAGGAPVLLPPLEDESALADTLGRLDGLLFPGGADVDPAHYGQPCHKETHVDEVLDTLELTAARWAANQALPTLGICRGQQLLNVALGGTLVQHLPHRELGEHSQVPVQAHVLGRQSTPRTELSHELRLEADSKLAAILGGTEMQVNSFHHQAVEQLAPGLRAVGWAPDGIVEAFESQKHPWLLAVQFHPEDLVGSHEPSQRLLRAFVQACAER